MELYFVHLWRLICNGWFWLCGSMWAFVCYKMHHIQYPPCWLSRACVCVPWGILSDRCLLPNAKWISPVCYRGDRLPLSLRVWEGDTAILWMHKATEASPGIPLQKHHLSAQKMLPLVLWHWCTANPNALQKKIWINTNQSMLQAQVFAWHSVYKT